MVEIVVNFHIKLASASLGLYLIVLMLEKS